MFADPNHALDALYFPPGEAVGVPCRAIVREERQEFASAVALATGTVTVGRVRASEVPRPRPHGRLAALGTTYEVQANPERDPSGVWHLGLVELSP